MPYIIRIHTADEDPATLAFEQAPIRIGRNQLNELVLNEPFVSHWHGIIQFEGGEATYMDLGSTNGTIVNGRRAPGHTSVSLKGTLKDAIEIGPIRLSVTMGEVPPQFLAARRRSLMDVSPGGGFTSALLRTAEGMADEGPALGGKKALARTQLIMPVAAPTADPAQLEAFLERIGSAYEASRRASAELAEQARTLLRELDETNRSAAAQHALAKLEHLRSEPELLQMFREEHVRLDAHEPVDVLGWLRRLTHGDQPSDEDPYRDVSPRLAMERVGAVLETFASALVELRGGYEQFGSEMALRVVHDETPLHEAPDTRAVLRYALDANRDGTQTVAALKEIFVDLAVHQVALLSGVMSGVRELLTEMSPARLRGGGTAMATKRSGGLFGFFLPFRNAALFRRYADLHAALVEEDRFTRTVFGKAFARAYFTVTGGRLERESNGDRGR